MAGRSAGEQVESGSWGCDPELVPDQSSIPRQAASVLDCSILCHQNWWCRIK